MISLPLALVLGVLLALAFLHCTGWSPGGLITPGYLVLYAADWRGLAPLLATAALTCLLAIAMQSWLPLYGRRRWAFCVATAVALRGAMEVLPIAAAPDPLGFIVPGLIASAAIQQGALPTITGAVTVTAATWWALIAGGML